MTSATLHERPSGDYLKRIARTNATHQVLYSTLDGIKQISPIDVCHKNHRGSKWQRVFVGSHADCENFINN